MNIMQIKCKKCNSSNYVKNGMMNGKQRYKCKVCACNFTDTEKRGAPLLTKINALRLYLLGMGLRKIGKYFGYSDVAVLNWIRGFGILAEHIHEARRELQDGEVVEEIELDEMRHYIKKNKTQYGYGSLSIAEGRELLILPSEIDHQKQGERYERI